MTGQREGWAGDHGSANRIHNANRRMIGDCETTGKRTYPTKSAAKESVRQRSKLHPDAASHVYQCPECGGFHTSRQPITMRDRDPLRQPLPEPDLAEQPDHWAKLTHQQTLGAQYALRVMRRVPGTPCELMDEAIIELTRQLRELGDLERERRRRNDEQRRAS